LFIEDGYLRLAQLGLDGWELVGRIVATGVEEFTFKRKLLPDFDELLDN
jgi:hypothetical protein